MVCELARFHEFYNKERIYEGLCYRTPDEIYGQGCFPVMGEYKKKM